MLRDFLFVMLGGSIGAAMRYATALAVAHIRIASLPIGTLSVNLIGCIILGLLTGLTERYTGIPRHITLMLTVGLCGAFTTFSTFSAETIRTLENSQAIAATMYVVVSVAGGLFLFWGAKSIVPSVL